MLTKQQRDAFEKEAIENMNRSMQVRDLVQINAESGGESWPVRIRARANEYFEATGRGSSLTIYITETTLGYLVSVPNYNRCGHVPGDCDAHDVMSYVGVENEVDATTLAVAVRWLISARAIHSHPELKR